MTRYYVRNRPAPWGDYGDILAFGMGTRDDRGILTVQRVGPYVPPAYVLTGEDLIVTGGARTELAGQIGTVSYAPVRVEKVVRLDWQDWPTTSPEPRVYPSRAEPENYILGRRHDESAAAAVGPLWEIIVDSAGDPVAPFIRGATGEVLASPAGRSALEAVAGEWLVFDPVD